MAHITIPNENPLQSFSVGGTAQDTFSITFVIFESDGSDVAVYNGDSLVDPADYTITPTAGTDGGFDGGELVLDTAVTNTTITVVRNMDFERTTDFPTAGPFDVNDLNTELDKIIARSQQLQKDVNRTIKYADTVSGITGASVGTPTDGYVLTFDGTTGAIVGVPSSSVDVITVPNSIIDNQFLRADGTSGAAYQAAGLIQDDSNNLSGINNLTATGAINYGDLIGPKGTWTPVVSFGTPGDLAVSYNQQTGRYVDRGDTAFIFGDVTFTPTFTTASGDFVISGMPFTPIVTGQGGPILSLAGRFPALPSGRTFAAAYASTGALIRINAVGSDQISDALTAAEFTTGTLYRIAFQIEVEK